MSNKKNRNPEKKERKRIEKQQQQMTFPVQSNNENTTKSGMSDIEKAKKYYNEGAEHYKNAHYDKAIECFTKAIELKPNYIEAYTYRGITCVGRGEHDNAIKDLKINPNYSVAYNNRGNAYNDKKDYDEAIKNYTKAIELNPNDAMAYYSRGNAHFSKRDYTQAIKDYDESIRLNPDYADAYYNRGNVYCDKDDDTQAIKDYDESIRLKPDYADAYYNRGLAYDKKGNSIQAIKDYTEAIKRNPNFAEAYYGRGNAYYQKGDYTQAIKDYDKAIRLNKDLEEAYSNRGLAYKNKGEYDLAIKDYDEAIRLNPKYVAAYCNRGNAHENKDEYDLAIKDFDKAIEISPNDVYSYYNKGITLVTLGENEKTKKLYIEWTKEANEHYIKWIKICIKNNIVDYSTSMFIYQLQYLLLKEKALTTEIDELTEKYIKTIVEFEHGKNADEIKKYSTKTDDNKNSLIIDEDGNIILYKYSSYDKNAIYNIKQRQMHFSDPSKFNDPFDPLIRVLDKEHSTGLMELLNFRVSCLSPKMDNLLLWSHYANKHKGICIAYDITKLVKQDNIIFRKIEHIEKFLKPEEGLMFASLNTVNELNKSATLINTFTQKHKVWNYEEEYRLILQTDKEFLPPVDIKEIYLGRDMPEEDKAFIYTMINEMNLKKAEDKDDIIIYSMDVSDDDIFKLKPTPMQLP